MSDCHILPLDYEGEIPYEIISVYIQMWLNKEGEVKNYDITVLDSYDELIYYYSNLWKGPSIDKWLSKMPKKVGEYVANLFDVYSTRIPSLSYNYIENVQSSQNGRLSNETY